MNGREGRTFVLLTVVVCGPAVAEGFSLQTARQEVSCRCHAERRTVASSLLGAAV